MAGAYYIWILGACFAGTVAVIGVFVLFLWLGHRLERREGATHGFLELPREFRKQAGTQTGVEGGPKGETGDEGKAV
jgi:hypothetical protein